MVASGKRRQTPIALSADDIRRSWREKLPGFEKTVDSSTRMIKQEVYRLTNLLDEFVNFARMSPPVFANVNIEHFIKLISELYSAEITESKLTIENLSKRTTFARTLISDNYR